MKKRNLVAAAVLALASWQLQADEAVAYVVEEGNLIRYATQG